MKHFMLLQLLTLAVLGLTTGCEVQGTPPSLDTGPATQEVVAEGIQEAIDKGQLKPEDYGKP